jgi:two-component system response regulator GlrR
MSPGKLLIVDDDRNLAELVKTRLESAHYDVVVALNEKDALEAARGQVLDLSVVDLQLVHQGGVRWDGIGLMEKLHLIAPEMPVIILTAHGSIESAVEAIKRGAFNYLTKPFDPRELLLQIERALETRRLSSEVQRLRSLLEEKYNFANIVAKSGKMQRVLEVVSRIARTDSTVFIHGESGTGKELIARAVHLASDRKDRTFVAINCAALPETLLDSELFGHEKGAFTGAIRSKKGLFTQAHEGTIFLDEVGDMPLAIQAKVLRVLQERQFYPLGSEKPTEVDVRLIVATNKDLEDQVKQGLFREDLFYRIHVIPVELPSLRERKEDIPPLIEHFLKKYNKQMNREVKGFTPQAMQKLMLHDWPGNVRELENTVEYGVAMTQQEFVTEEFVRQPGEAVLEKTWKPFKEAKEVFERDYLMNLLQHCEGNVSKAAELAGKYRADFYDLIKKHNINLSEFKKPS